jgi:hypothetical protein
MEERRRHKRISKSFMSWLKFFRGEQEDKRVEHSYEWDMVTTRDLSAGGILFNYDKQVGIGIGAKFKVVFPFADHLIECTGKVIRDEKVSTVSMPNTDLHRVAAQFGSIKESDACLIEKIANQ